MDDVVEIILEAKWNAYGKNNFYKDLYVQTAQILLFFINSAFVIPLKIKKSVEESTVITSTLYSFVD